MENNSEKHIGFLGLLASQGVIKIIASFLAGGLFTTVIIFSTVFYTSSGQYFTGKVIETDIESYNVSLNKIEVQIEELLERIKNIEEKLFTPND